MNTSRLWPGLIIFSVACGSRFEATPGAGDTGGGSGSSADTGGASNTTGGTVDSAGAGSSADSGAGTVGSAGAHGGSTGTGHGGAGSSGSTGSTSGAGGSLGGQTGTGGASGVGGAGGAQGGGTAGAATGGGAGAGGSPSNDCGTLQSTYLSDLEKARVCNPNALKAECSNDSTLPGSCGCQVLVAAGTAATAKARAELKAFNDAGCKAAACGVACIQYPAAMCAPANGGTATVCSGAAAP